MKRYNPAAIEPKWQKKWAESKIYAAADFSDKPKFVMLTEFPYPSGAGLHMGHLREYTLGDIIARYKRTCGHNVLFPMGYDAFGLPTENYAIKNKISPQLATEQNTATFRRQLDMMGYSIDWDRSFATSDPEYYHWTQWMFLQFYKAGLAYQDEIAINWCPFCKTGLANEEVVGGRHERCDNLVEKKMMKQWMLRITDYAERLIDGLDGVDYPSRIADQQINWVGKSVGAEIKFKICHSELVSESNENNNEILKQVQDDSGITTVFTTRPDTIFGATFMVLAPEHPLVAEITAAEQKAAVDSYIKTAQSKSEVERQDTNREKTGVFTGAYAINLANDEKIPIWIADYVLMGYGTGAIMAVPAHDERDYEFAQKFDIETRQVIAPSFGEKYNGETKKSTGTAAIGYNPATKKYLIMHTDKGDWRYRLPCGGIEDGESFEECARRELAEETGYQADEIIPATGIVAAQFHNTIKDTHNDSRSIIYLAIINNIDSVGAGTRENHESDFRNVWLDYEQIHKEIAAMSPNDDHWLYALERSKLIIENDLKPISTVFVDKGILVNSDQFDGLDSVEAGEKIVEWLGEKGAAEPKVNYKLRDWVYSRQHYWGEPIPIIHCAKCGAVPVPDDQLPVELPTVDHYEPTDDGQSPLSRIEQWVETTCPKCGGSARRETDTMPNWAGSNWYYLRYFDAHNNEKFADPEKLKYWGAVDMYLGGMEHTTLHLLYSRFHHQFLYDQGLVPTPEPYAARRGQGIILAADGRKMSKSLGNVVDPTPIIESGYGADAARLAITFLAPYDQTTPWSPEAVAGCYRFLGRVWNLAQEVVQCHSGLDPESKENNNKILKQVQDDKGVIQDGSGVVRDDNGLLRAQHRTVKKVTEDLENMNFNTAIAALMEYLNVLTKDASKVSQENVEILLQLLAPFAPHIANELYEQMGARESIDTVGWPEYDEKYLVSDEITIAVQVNGKLRGEVTVATDASEDEIKTAALAIENVAAHLGDKKPARIIYVPGKILNVVI